MDIRSSIIINFILTFLMTVYLCILWLKNRSYSRGIGIYLLGNSIVSVFILLVTFQNVFPPFFTIVVSNTAILAGQVLIYHSFYLFSGRKTEQAVRMLSVIVPLLILAEQTVFGMIIPSLKVRIFSMTAATFYCNAVLLAVLFKSRKSLGSVIDFLIVSVVILMINNISRIFLTIYMPAVQSFLDIPRFQGSLVIVRSVIMAFWPFGFAMLILEKSRDSAESSSEQKTLLLRELSHRTKNNMSIIISLLNMQGMKLPDRTDFDREFILRLLETVRNRINSLALVYKNLLNTKNLSKIAADEYIRELADNLRKSLLPGDSQTEFILNLDPIILSLETSGYLGLILNELLTNSMKYAFSDTSSGTINIGFTEKKDGSLLFSYSDNGTGMEPKENTAHDSIGLSMITLLSEEQLHGDMEMNSAEGFHFSLQFRDNLYSQRV